VNKAFVPLLVFVLMVALILLVSEGMSGERWQAVATATVWRGVLPSTNTPVPQVNGRSGGRRSRPRLPNRL